VPGNKPRVGYCETLGGAVRTEGESVRQAGGSGLFARLTVAFEPLASGKGIVVVNALPEGTLTPELAHAAEQGVRGALQSGELGYPVIDVRATLRAAQMQEDLSNDIAFTAAGTDAVHKALRDNMVLLE